jgi:hypothetical protein
MAPSGSFLLRCASPEGMEITGSLRNVYSVPGSNRSNKTRVGLGLVVFFYRPDYPRRRCRA